jgi:hypothetical protein
MSELERELRALGRQLDFPPPPDLVSALRPQLDLVETRRLRAARPFAWRTRRALVLALVLVGLAAATALAIPPVRDAISDLLGISGVTIERTTAPPPKATPQPEQRLLGHPSSLASAARSLAFRPIVPSALGRVDAVYLSDLPPGGAVSLAYRARPGLPRAATTGFGLVATEFRGDLAHRFLGKIVPMADRVERFELSGSPAVWIAGPPHFFYFRAPRGGVRRSPLLVAQHVLLVERGRLLVRLEGAMSRAEAVRIARSLD